MSDLRVSEMFYSPQGEGARAGEMSVFVRLQGCSAKHACFAAGVRCDTEFESGVELPMAEVLTRARVIGGDCRWIVWTGGEPLDQLTPEHLLASRGAGWLNAIETSGARVVTPALADLTDWLVCSPKVAEHVLVRHFAHVSRLNRRANRTRPNLPATPFASDDVVVDELRYPRHTGQGIPEPALTAAYYYLSPHAQGAELDPGTLRHVLALAAAHPDWRISVQQHKVWSVL